jgi:hypothetical protein
MTDKNKNSTYFEMPQLAVAPMMDGDDLVVVSVICVVPCAAHVHVSIA